MSSNYRPSSFSKTTSYSRGNVFGQRYSAQNSGGRTWGTTRVSTSAFGTTRAFHSNGTSSTLRSTWSGKKWVKDR
jgi:hypothetical protein